MRIILIYNKPRFIFTKYRIKLIKLTIIKEIPLNYVNLSYLSYWLKWKINEYFLFNHLVLYFMKKILLCINVILVRVIIFITYTGQTKTNCPKQKSIYPLLKVLLCVNVKFVQIIIFINYREWQNKTNYPKQEMDVSFAKGFSGAISKT